MLPWLRTRYHLDTIAGDSKSEIDQLIELRNWVHGRWEPDCCDQPRRFDALSILDAAERGQRFRNVEYAIVLTQVYRAMRYCSRFVRFQGEGGDYAVTEVFAPQLGKWVLMDAQHATHVSLDGKLLSAIEVRDALAAGKALDAHVDTDQIDDATQLVDVFDFIMVSSNSSYGHELDELVVLAPEELSAPKQALVSPTYALHHNPQCCDPR